MIRLLFYDWTTDYSWGERWVDKKGIKTSADACPDGLHIPKTSEWGGLITLFSTPNDFFNSKLRLPLTGNTHPVPECNIHAIYWSSGFNKGVMGRTQSQALYFSKYRCYITDRYAPIDSTPIRCIRDIEIKKFTFILFSHIDKVLSRVLYHGTHLF